MDVGVSAEPCYITVSSREFAYLSLTSLLTVLRFRIYSILHAFTFLVNLIRIGYKLQVFRGK